MAGYVHVGHLWSSSGQLLATATFTNETASGWQQVSFSRPVAIQAFTVYIASFSTGGGDFGVTTKFFTSSGVVNGPLQALANGVPGGDGVYNRAGSFPDVSGNGMNYWADVAFTPSNGGVIYRYAFRPADSSAAGGLGVTILTTGQPNRMPTISAPAATGGVLVRSGTVAPGAFSSVVSFWSSRGPVTQAGTLGSLWTSTRGGFLSLLN
jgi:hypothetical protein